MNEEPEDTLQWHALNYRTAHTMHAEQMWQVLDGFVRELVRAAKEQERERAALIAEDQCVAFGKGAYDFNAGCEACAAAIRSYPA